MRVPALSYTLMLSCRLKLLVSHAALRPVPGLSQRTTAHDPL